MWDVYLKMEGAKVHCFSIINSLMVMVYLLWISVCNYYEGTQPSMRGSIRNHKHIWNRASKVEVGGV
jgi:hypothetical protein